MKWTRMATLPGRAYRNLLYNDLRQLGASLTTAFEPILNVVTPILDYLIQKLVAATNALAQFFSALTGKKFYTKAIKQNKDYTDSLNGAAKAAKNLRPQGSEKVATTAVLAHGMILTSCSYILSWIGMDPVVDVSSTIVKEIVAPLVVYLGTNTIMNIFEKNKLSFSVPINSTVISKDGTTHKASDDEAVG